MKGLNIRNFLFVTFYMVLGVTLGEARLLPSSAQESQAILGKGYNTVEEHFAGDCVKGSLQYIGLQDSSVVFERSLSQTELADSLGFSVGGWARYGVIKASAAAKFASESTSNDYSEVTTYMAEYNFKNIKMNYKGLTEVGKLAKGDNQTYTWDNWEKTCGHEYVEQIKLGAKIMISAKVEFSTREDKKSFQAEFSIKGPAFGASGQLKKASRKFGKSAAVVIRAYQLGGNVSRLSSIFGAGDNARVENEGQSTHAILACSMSKIDACLKVLDNAINYATDIERSDSFPNQINSDYSLDDPNGPAYLAYITKPWSDLALYSPPPIIAESVKQARSELSYLFEENLKMAERVRGIISSPMRLISMQMEKVDNAHKITLINSNKIFDTAFVCYLEPERCVKQLVKLKDELKHVKKGDLDIFPESFAQYCDQLSTGRLSFSNKKTVEVILDELGENYDLNAFDDACGTAEKVLSELRNFDLSFRNLVSIEPLVPMKNLRTLNLKGNKISTIDSIKNLSNLKRLYLQSNRIENIEAITKLKKLNVVMMGHNMIRKIPALKSMVSIEKLWLENNKLTDISGVAEASNLLSLRLNNNKITEVTPIADLDRLQVLTLANNRICNFDPLKKIVKNLESLTAENNNCPIPEFLESLVLLEL